MKKFNFINSLKWAGFVFLLGFILSCAEQHEPQIKTTQKIRFGVGNVSSVNGRTQDSATPAKIRLSVEQEGSPVYQEEDLTLFSFGDAFVTDAIDLEVGTYELTYFLVLTSQNDVIYAAPMEGSEFAWLVENPLPVSFQVVPSDTTVVAPEVIAIAETENPSQFGYAAFGFSVINTFSLGLEIKSAWDSSALTGQWQFVAYDSDSIAIGTSSFTHPSDTAETVVLNGNAAFYKVSLQNDMHHEVTHYIEASYLEEMDRLVYTLADSALFEKYEVQSPGFGLNSWDIYLPKDGCLPHARVDGIGLASTEATSHTAISRFLENYHTGTPLTYWTGVVIESFDNPTFFFYPDIYPAASGNDCDLFPDYDLRMSMTFFGLFDSTSVLIILSWNAIDEVWTIDTWDVV